MDINLSWLAVITILALLELFLALPEVGLISDNGEAVG
jgi:hypothetical protein